MITKCETQDVSGSAARLYPLLPHDSKWDDFLQVSRCASIFHTTEWLEALRRTYGYEPFVCTTSRPDARVQNGLVFCRVQSWLTGCRLVSLPFSDHCDPLVDDPSDLQKILDRLTEEQNRNKMWRYIEMRPTRRYDVRSSLFRSTCDYAFHQLDLSPALSRLFGGFHKDSTQRKIRRAEREGLRYEEGHSELLLSSFYRLLVLTRRRRGVPPQPLLWFRNLVDCLGQSLQIRIAFKGSQAVAAILTIRYKGTLLYKYGCSDHRFHNLGGMHFLLWRSIQEAKGAGLDTFDFGRSDSDNEGLIRFKDRWGGRRTTLTYSRYTAAPGASDNYAPPAAEWKLRFAKTMLSHAPGKLLSLVGATLYKHVG